MPAELAAAAAVGREMGFDEINLNVGCPSDRVQSGCFGAALMRTPGLVADCAAAMIAAAGPVPVTVKCRIGVDEQDPEAVLPAFLETVAAAGVRRFAIHARKAWLAGPEPEGEPRDPAARPRARRADEGGASRTSPSSSTAASTASTPPRRSSRRGLDGVMIGRAAYHAPALLGAADRRDLRRPRPRRGAGGRGRGDAALHRGRARARHRRSTPSPGTCSAPSRAGPAPAPGGGCSPRARTAPGAGPELVRAALGARSRRSRPAEIL